MFKSVIFIFPFILPCFLAIYICLFNHLSGYTSLFLSLLFSVSISMPFSLSFIHQSIHSLTRSPIPSTSHSQRTAPFLNVYKNTFPPHYLSYDAGNIEVLVGNLSLTYHVIVPEGEVDTVSSLVIMMKMITVESFRLSFFAQNISDRERNHA